MVLQYDQCFDEFQVFPHGVIKGLSRGILRGFGSFQGFSESYKEFSISISLNKFNVESFVTYDR